MGVMFLSWVMGYSIECSIKRLGQLTHINMDHLPPSESRQGRYTEGICCIWTKGQTLMLSWAMLFFLIAIVAAVFGFSGIAGAATNIAWILFIAFLVLAVFALITGRGRGLLS